MLCAVEDKTCAASLRRCSCAFSVYSCCTCCSCILDCSRCSSNRDSSRDFCRGRRRANQCSSGSGTAPTHPPPTDAVSLPFLLLFAPVAIAPLPALWQPLPLVASFRNKSVHSNTKLYFMLPSILVLSLAIWTRFCHAGVINSYYGSHAPCVCDDRKYMPNILQPRSIR